MLIENLDKTISVGIAVVSAWIGWKSHLKQMQKERERISQEQRDKYAAQMVAQTNEQRDFAHLKRNLEQLSSNVQTLSQDSDRRLDDLERQVNQLMGAVKLLRSSLSINK